MMLLLLIHVNPYVLMCIYPFGYRSNRD